MRRAYAALASSALCFAVLLSCSHRMAEGEGSPAVAPFTAHVTITAHRVLPDGSSLNTGSADVQARDRQGRTYARIAHEFQNGEQKTEWFSFLVEDPARKQTLTWDSKSQVAVLGHWPYWSGRKGCWADEHGQNQVSFGDWYKVPDSPKAGKLETIATIAEGDKQIKTRIVTENLGQKEIHGLPAYGMRTTMVPLESGGPDAMPEHTTELWRSKEFDLTLLKVTNGPKYGSERLELSDLQRGDPDPALFQPPQGYTIQNVQYQQVTCGQN